MLTARLWSPESKTLRAVEPAELEKGKDQLATGASILWIDLSAPTTAEEDLVFGRFLPVHPLSLEDITRLRREPDAPPHFPKVEEFGDYLLVIVNPVTAAYAQRLARQRGPERILHPFTQLSGIITRNILVTHHYEALDCVAQIEQYLQRHQEQAGRGPDYLFHLVLDCTVDQYVPMLDAIDEALDRLELEVIQRPQRNVFLRLLRLKQEIIQLRKTFVLQREVLVRLTRGEFDLVSPEETVYYRNVYDHLVRFTELIESSREMVTDLMQSYLASVSNRLSEIMKVLTMISTIVLPMNLIAGIYGMNFKNMPELEQPWGYPLALVLMAITGLVGFVFFRWKKWM